MGDDPTERDTPPVSPKSSPTAIRKSGKKTPVGKGFPAVRPVTARTARRLLISNERMKRAEVENGGELYGCCPRKGTRKVTHACYPQGVLDS